MPAIGARGPMPALPPSKPPPAPRGVGAAVSSAAKGSPPIRLATPAPKPIGGSDALSSGPGYGSAEANAYKAGPGYHQAVKAVFQHQPPAQQAAILKGALSGKADAPTAAAIRDGYDSLPAQQKRALSLTFPKGGTGIDLSGVGKGISDALGTAEQGLMSLHNSATASPTGRLSASGFAPQTLGTLAVKVPTDIARAAIESPATIPKTVKGLGETAVGGLAGLAQLPVSAVENVKHDGLVNGIGKTFTDLTHSMANDYSARYGPLLQGNDRAFIDRLKKQGAGAEVLDALGLVGGVDATAGRALVDAAKTGEKVTGAANFLTRERPGLRVSGGDVRPQQLAKGAMKITAQRAEDKLRAVKEAHSPGEILPNAGEVRPLFGNRSQRILASHIGAKYRRTMQDTLNREVRNGAARNLVRLSAAERKALPIVGEGFIPLGRGRQAALDAIDARVASIVKDRADSPLSPGNHIPPEFTSKVDELHQLADLRKNVDKWLTPRLADTIAKESTRQARLEHAMPDSYLRQPVAEARRLRPQGEMLGIEHPDVINERLAGASEVAGRGGPHVLQGLGADLARGRRIEQAKGAADKYANYEESRPGLLQDYSGRVRAAAQEKGLPEPLYMEHRDIPGAKLGNFTSGMGARAMPGPKRSTFALWKGGAVTRNPDQYLEGLARSIKTGHQWPLVNEQMRRSALPEPSAAAIKAAGMGARRADSLTGREYARAMQFEGHKIENLRFYNPGRLRQSTLEERGLGAPEKAALGGRAGSVPPELGASSDLHALVGSETRDGRKLNKLDANDPFVKTAGWKALPATAYDEIHSSLSPSGLGGRLTGKAQGLAAGAILGGSPSFLVMNTLAHMVLASFGTRGRLLTDAAKFPLWWHGLSEEQRSIIDSHAGGRGAFHVERLGAAAPHQLAESWRNLKEKGIGRFTVGRASAGISHLNPVRAMFRAEDMQSNFFRRMVYYNATKKTALDNMGREMSYAANAANRLNHVFTLGPKERMIATISNMHTAEELGRHTVNMMGDYTRFTNFERKFINNRAILFYSFMRHATRTLFYVLPLHHPILTALTAEMAKLHNDEVKKMLGGADLPYAYSRLYFGQGGHLTSIDFARASPVGSIGADLSSRGISGAAQVIPPEAGPILDQIYGHTPTGAPVNKNAWSLLNGFASLSYPYRLLGEIHNGTTLQQSDSVPYLHDRPQTKKTAAAQAYQAAKQQALGPKEQKIIASMFGIVPKPDDVKVVAQHQNAAAASKAARASGAVSGPVIPGVGGTSGVAIPGSGSTSSVVIP